MMLLACRITAMNGECLGIYQANEREIKLG